ncbi:MAG: hypothetical protein DHS20C05_09950 [Hyphococcus sp.]|nr:MAG: hypothetical protein DHS20C05_09950 [Marinicaulis sp.]
MLRKNITNFILLLTIVTSAACAQSDGLANRSSKAADKVTIVSETGEHQFTVEIADDDPTRQLGLMYRESMAEDAGMLFDFEQTRPVAMWMKNTLISLDMAFIDEEGVILTIAAETTPRSLESIPSGPPVLAVLEVNAGIFEELGVKPGDKVLHPIFDRK